jgi:predicted  nucleic acid-binding Zn-ribbon protein
VPDPAPDRDELEALLQLQRGETAIKRLERRLEELPEQAALDASVETAAAIKADQDAHRVGELEIDAEIRKLEGELELLQQRRADEQQRMYAGEITNPRELQAIRAEIGSVARRIEHLEETLLEVMERREELSGAVATLDQRRLELIEEEERLTEARDEAAQGILAELAETRAERDAHRQALTEPLLERYEEKKGRLGGVGVGALEQGICTACRLELTPLERSELRHGPPLGTCPQCQRLLVVLD